MAIQRNRGHAGNGTRRRQQIVVRELPARLRERHRSNVVGGRIDVHVPVLEFPGIDVHAADRAHGVRTESFAQVNLVVLVEPPEPVVAAAAVEHEVAVAQDVVPPDQEGSQRIPEGLPEGDGLAPVVCSRLTLRKLRVAHQRGFSGRERAHHVDLALPIRLGIELRVRPPPHGEGAFLEQHVRRIGVGIQSQPRFATFGGTGVPLVAPHLLAVSAHAGSDRGGEGVHGVGPRRVRGVPGRGRAISARRCERQAVVDEHPVGDPWLVDDIGLGRSHPIRLVGRGAEIHQIPVFVRPDVRKAHAIDELASGAALEEVRQIAIQAAHGVRARDVVPPKAIEIELLRAIQVTGGLRAHLIEVDLHVGVDGCDGRPHVGADIQIAEAIDVDEVVLSELRHIRIGESGAASVIHEERRYELARSGLRLRHDRQRGPQQQCNCSCSNRAS